MTTEKMTVHKALAELKIVDDRIISAINGGTYCVANKHSNEKIKGVPIEEYKGVMQGYYDKATDLIKRRNAIKRAVVLSNATTKVTVNGLEYTVAEAIEMKNHGVEFDEKMLDVLNKQYNKAQSEILKQNGDDLEKRAEQYVIGIYGSKEKVRQIQMTSRKPRRISLQQIPMNLLIRLRFWTRLTHLKKVLLCLRQRLMQHLALPTLLQKLKLAIRE